MKTSTLAFACIAGMACSAAAFAQRVTDRRTAEIRGGGGDGKCTIEVLVDDTAEVEVRGTQAVIRTIAGAPSTFRRFQCNQAMPTMPYDFRFRGIDGRGRQDLVATPDQRGFAVIRIQDSKGGNEGYTFDLEWRGGTDAGFGGGGFGQGGGGYRPGNGGGFNRPGFGNGNNGGNWNGWGNGNGWGNEWGAFNFQGRGNGEFEDRNGYRSRLNDVNVSIQQNGYATLAFQTDRGIMSLNGNVDRRDNRSVFIRVNDGNIRGLVEVEMNGRDRVRRINLNNNGRNGRLNWSN
ncbi:hypothetical protein F183_A01150 [Bryobacterales bacterium F-183]|nr:hypothetical protein F183_A01150 [Bryobacterales bacterium F-183]